MVPQGTSAMCKCGIECDHLKEVFLPGVIGAQHIALLYNTRGTHDGWERIDARAHPSLSTYISESSRFGWAERGRGVSTLFG